MRYKKHKQQIVPGAVYGRWTVLREDPTPTLDRRVICRCSCGTECSRRLAVLIKGASLSCGCFAKEVARDLGLERSAAGVGLIVLKHGHVRKSKPTPEYTAWAHMNRRCHKETDPEYHKYGGRGIFVCDEWRASFEAFFVAVGLRPSPKHSLDRIDNNGGYTPENVRWATIAEQLRNTRRNRWVTLDAETKVFADWCAHFNIAITTVLGRLKKGWSIEAAFKTLAKRTRNANGTF